MLPSSCCLEYEALSSPGTVLVSVEEVAVDDEAAVLVVAAAAAAAVTLVSILVATG